MPVNFTHSYFQLEGGSRILPSRSVPASFHEKVKQEISEKIASGIWQPHDRIPSEAELVAQYGFSRMTINRALRELTNKSLLVHLQGVEMPVTEPKSQSVLFEIHSIADEIDAYQYQHRCKVLTLEKTQANAQQALVLNVKEGTSTFHSVVVYYENDLPAQIEDRCVNTEIVSEYLAQDYSQATSHAYLSLMIPLTEDERIVETVRASAEECALLDIEERDPCLLIRRKTWSALSIVFHTRLLFPSFRYRLQGRFIS